MVSPAVFNLVDDQLATEPNRKCVSQTAQLIAEKSLLPLDLDLDKGVGAKI